MLLNLYVKNMALIQEADVSFKKGLNILTGETGAGKSIIIGSINIALGNKVSADIIRKGADYAVVELAFLIEDPERIRQLKQMDIEELDEGQITITRKITSSRSVIRVNGEAVSASQVKKIASLLIDIHGQHEHQSLLNEHRHLQFVDQFAGAALLEWKRKVNEEYHTYTTLVKKLDLMNIDEEQRQREISFMRFEIDEINGAGLKPDEDEELELRYKKMINSQKIADEISSVDQNISGNSFDSISEQIGKSIKSLTGILSLDSELEPILAQFYDLESITNDLARDISVYASNLEYDHNEFEAIQERLNLINSLKMKYGKTIESILSYAEDRAKKLEEYEHYDQVREELKKQIENSEKILEQYCEKLSIIRKESSKILEERITAALTELNFNSARFAVKFEKTSGFTSEGYDIVKFLIAANPGEDLKPLAKVASGGEISRIMLAIKTVMADKETIDTLIFDEIDSGISGKTAQMVSDKLMQVASIHQTICITHLPQIAAMADTHFVIEKTVEDQTTKTSIRELEQDGSIEELARLLGGMELTDAVVNNAREMKSRAAKKKKEFRQKLNFSN